MFVISVSEKVAAKLLSRLKSPILVLYPATISIPWFLVSTAFAKNWTLPAPAALNIDSRTGFPPSVNLPDKTILSSIVIL